MLRIGICFFTVNRRIAVEGRGDKEKVHLLDQGGPPLQSSRCLIFPENAPIQQKFDDQLMRLPNQAKRARHDVVL